MYEPCFDTLRTKQALGYTVYSTADRTRGVVGFRIVVKGSAVPAADADARIEGFVARFAAVLAAMPPAAFASHRDSLVSALLEHDDSLTQEADRHWSAITSGRALGPAPFRSREREAAYLRTVAQGAFVDWYGAHFPRGGPSRRRLSVHVCSPIPPTGYVGADPPEGVGGWGMPGDDGAVREVVLGADGGAMPRPQERAEDMMVLASRYGD